MVLVFQGKGIKVAKMCWKRTCHVEELEKMPE
jgi:hypothetical protein